MVINSEPVTVAGPRNDIRSGTSQMRRQVRRSALKQRSSASLRRYQAAGRDAGRAPAEILQFSASYISSHMVKYRKPLYYGGVECLIDELSAFCSFL